MSMSACRAQLEAFIADEKVRVIALSGAWGTGKTHLWKEIQLESSDLRIRNALYASLFGLTSIDELKLKLVESLVPADENGILETTKVVWDRAKVVLKGVHRAFEALDGVSLLLIPSLLKRKFIVIDDIERKHDRLGVDEILGFIDNLTQSYGARVLLVLNEGQLQKDKDRWELFREKVVDQEARLNTTPQEAYAIAVGDVPSPFASHIQTAAGICGVTNIRVARKINCVVNTLMHGGSNLASDVQKRMVSSIVLLAAIYFKGIQDGPSIDFILKFDASHVMGLALNDVADEKDNESAPPSHTAWRTLMEDLEIAYVDEFEPLVANYLQGGLVDSTLAEKIVERYVGESRHAQAAYLANVLISRELWDWKASQEELLGLARDIQPLCPWLSASTISSLLDCVSRIDVAQTLAAQMLEAWMQRFREDVLPNLDLRDDWNHFREKLHPEISAAYEKAREQLQ